MSLPIKDPDDVLDYKLSWAEWLSETDGDTIATSTWIVPTGIVEDEAKRSSDATSATIWLSGGTAGVSYLVTNRITTAQGRTIDRSMTIAVRDR